MDNSLVVEEKDMTIEDDCERVTATIVVDSMLDLRNLYSGLISPMKEIEGVFAEKNRVENDYNEAKDILKLGILRPILMAIKFTIMIAVPFLVCFLVFTIFKKNDEGVRWITLYTDWFANNTHILDYILKPIISPLPHWLGAILLVILSILIVCVIAPVVMFAFPVVLIITTIISLIVSADAKATTVSAPKRIDILENDIELKLKKIEAQLAFVPPDYRTSDALEYICKCVDNYKADTLKEALLQYDEYAHRRVMEEGQQQMISLQLEILSAIQYQSQQLDKLNRNIKSVEHAVWANTILK